MLKVVQKIRRSRTKVMVLKLKNKKDDKILGICKAMTVENIV